MNRGIIQAILNPFVHNSKMVVKQDVFIYVTVQYIHINISSMNIEHILSVIKHILSVNNIFYVWLFF